MPEGPSLKSVEETKRVLEKEKKKNLRKKGYVSKIEVEENMYVRKKGRENVHEKV